MNGRDFNKIVSQMSAMLKKKIAVLKLHKMLFRKEAVCDFCSFEWKTF